MIFLHNYILYNTLVELRLVCAWKTWVSWTRIPSTMDTS